MISLCITSTWAHGTEDNQGGVKACDMNGTNFSDIISTITPSKCLSVGWFADQCKCIREQVKISDAAASSVETGKNAIQEEIERYKSPYREQFSAVYKKVTVQAAAQEEVLGISDKSKPIGCTPKDISDNIQEISRVSIPQQISALQDLRNTNSVHLKTCTEGEFFDKVLMLRMKRKGCDYYKNREELIDKKILKINSSSCSFAVNAFNNEDSRKKINEVIKSIYSSNASNSRLITNVFAWRGYLEGKETVKSLIEKKFAANCSELISNFNYLMQFHDIAVSKINMKDSLTVPGSNNAQCANDDIICQSFSKKNNDLLKNTLTVYDPKEQDCVTFAEYSTYRGMPGPELLKDLAKSQYPEQLLTDHHANSKHPERIRFLQANPLLAVVARGGGSVALGSALKKMAIELLNKKDRTEKGDFNAYLAFMKGDFKKLHKEAGSAKMTVCHELARNYTAIEISDQLPPLENEYDPDDNDIKKTNRLIRRCIGETYSGLSVGNLNQSLKLSPIYSLGETLAGSEPSLKGFEEFNKTNCEGFAEHRNKNCTAGKMDECRRSFNPDGVVAGIQGSMSQAGARSVIPPDGALRMAAQTDSTMQDDQQRDWIKQNVTDKLSKSALASSKDKGEFAASMEQNRQIYSNPNISSNYQKYQAAKNPGNSLASSGLTGGATSTPSTATTSIGEQAFSRSSEDSSQVRPNFNIPAPVSAPVTNFASIPPETIRNAKEITQIDPVFDSRTDEAKLSTYKALKKFSDESGTEPAFDYSEEVSDLQKTIAKSEEELKEIEKIEDEEENKKEKSGKIAQAGSRRSRAPASFSQSSFAAPISSSPVLGQFPGSGNSVSSSGAKMSKVEASYQAALLKKHELSPDLQIVIQGNNAVAPYLVPERNIVTADSEYPFEDLQIPNKLSEFLAVKLGNSVQNGESVKIMNPKTNDYFVMKATKKEGVLSYQLIPFVAKEKIRMLTLGSLNNEIEQYKKK